MSTLENKTAIITGAAQGLGQALAGRLATEGCSVLVADIQAEAADKTAKEITKATGRPAIATTADVTDETKVEAIFNLAMEKFGQVDVVVSNAAILIAEPVTEADASKWRAVMNVNLFGNFLVFKHACRIMRQQKSGSIIQINSKSGKKGSRNNSAYAAAKFGGIGLVQSVALEMAPYNVRVNAVCPGNLLESPLWTDPQKGLFTQYLNAGKVPGAKSLDDVRKHYTNQVPLGRGCAYEDIANMVVFLASDQASYMTGQAINVTGGQEMG